MRAAGGVCAASPGRRRGERVDPPTSVSNPRRRRRSPELKPTAFTARPPDLPPRPSMAVDFAITCSFVRPGRRRYPVLVHRAAALLRASFRPHLAMTRLRFANASPPSGWIEDLQAVDYARHTSKSVLAGASTLLIHISISKSADQAIFSRRRRYLPRPNRPPQAAIRVGNPAPTIGPGTAAVETEVSSSSPTTP
jgi:hypothetical protein